jgi:hypothetical protein
MKVRLANEGSFLRNIKSNLGWCHVDLDKALVASVGRRSSPQRPKDRVNEPSPARNHDDHKIPKQMRRI